MAIILKFDTLFLLGYAFLKAFGLYMLSYFIHGVYENRKL